MKYILTALLFTSMLLFSCEKNTKNKQFIIENESIVLEINQLGGAFSAMRLKDNSLNFLSWKLSREDMPENNRKGAAFEGHFLCFGRWGSPTAGEIKKGIPHNGEHNNLMWSKETGKNTNEWIMTVSAASDAVNIERKIKLAGEQALFKVTEKFTSTSNLGRISNIVQHVTLGPPFINPLTQFYSNAGKGFLQENCWPDPSVCEYDWPNAISCSGDSFSLSQFNHDRNFVSTHIIADSTGWALAVDPVSRQYAGYMWKTEDYPWINFWNQNRGQHVFAYGMEFGTTGIGRTYEELVVKNPEFHGHSSFFFMDAGETITKSYFGFCGKIPASDCKFHSFIPGKIIRINFEDFDGNLISQDFKTESI